MVWIIDKSDVLLQLAKETKENMSRDDGEVVGSEFTDRRGTPLQPAV